MTCRSGGGVDIVVSYVFPTWALQTAILCSFSAGMTIGTSLIFRTHQIIPKDSKIFQYCYEGNLESLQQLYANGQAFSTAADSDLDTLLHVRVDSTYGRRSLLKLT